MHQKLAIDTIHGPRMDLREGLPLINAVADVAAELGAPVVVLHAGPFAFDESELLPRLKAVLQFSRSLEGVAQNTGRKFALENVMPGPATELVRTALQDLDIKYFGFCYDSSHDQIGGPKPFDLLSDLANRVIAVHLSDRIAEFVDHMPPKEGFIDWERLIATLRTTHFSGPLLFEVMVTNASQKEVDPFLELVYRQACWVKSIFERAD